MHPPIHFVTSGDGVRIAYCAHGTGAPLVYVRGWISHLEMMWNVPAFRAYCEALAERFTVIRYDSRDNGLSGRTNAEPSLEALVDDLRCVIDEAANTPVVLYGEVFGGPIAMAYAAAAPDRVAALVLDGTYARGDALAPPNVRESFLSMLRSAPDGALTLMGLAANPAQPNDLEERTLRALRSISPDAAVRLYSLGLYLDVSAMLPAITVPTLVLHHRHNRYMGFRCGREVAAGIPGARLVPLSGAAMHAWEGDTTTALAAAGEFLGVPLVAGRKAAESGPLAILFTDIEGSTSFTQRLGDDEAQQLVRRHDLVARRAFGRFEGSEISHTGDGMMASFPSALRALECAQAIQAELDEDPDVRVKIGVNAGEPVRDEGNLFGTAVQLASRITEIARGGEILVSDVVRQLVAGKRFTFSDRGEYAFKGFELPVRVYALDRSLPEARTPTGHAADDASTFER